MPTGYMVWDYRIFVLDFSTSCLIGRNPHNNISCVTWRLSTAIPEERSNYNDRLEDLII